MHSSRTLPQAISKSITNRHFSSKPKNVVIVDGLRIPFTTAGSVYSKYIAVDLARMALKGIITKTAIDPKSVDYLYVGTVIQEPKTSNIAREAGLGAGIPISVVSVYSSRRFNFKSVKPYTPKLAVNMIIIFAVLLLLIRAISYFGFNIFMKVE
jgi:hypothetical protein